jgi:lysophospholipase L1-like esterase
MTRKWRLVLLVSLIGNLTIAYVGYKAWDYREHINYWLEKYLFVVDEFSERDEYAEANQALQSDSLVSKRIVFFGTQVTADWPLESYFPGFETVNRGVTGQRAAGFLLRFRPDVIALYPQYVVFEVSSYNFRPNTRASEIYDYVVSMAELARYHGIQPILTTCIPPRVDFEVDEHADYLVRDTAAMYSDWLRQFAAEHNFLLADWETAVAGSDGFLRADLARSRVDPNPDGYGVMAEAVLRAVGHDPSD